MGHSTRVACLCILVLVAAQPCFAGWIVDKLTGRVEISSPGNNKIQLLSRGQEVSSNIGTVKLSRGSSLRLRYADGSALSLASGSVLHFIKGGLWLKLKAGSLLVEVSKDLAKKMKLGFLSSYVRPKGVGAFSLTTSKEGRQVLFVLAGAVKVAKRGFGRVIQEGMKAAWVKGQLKTRSFAQEKARRWWAKTMGAAAIFRSASKKDSASTPAFERSARLAVSLPTEVPKVSSVNFPFKGRDSAKGSLHKAPGITASLISFILSKEESFPLGTILGSFVLFVGVLALLAHFLRTTAAKRRTNHRYTTAGVVSSLVTQLGFAKRCSSCSGNLQEGIIVSVAVEADVERYRPSLMAYEDSAIMDSIWDDLESEVKSRRLMGKGTERVTLSYSRCEGCLRSIYRLSVGKDVLAEYAGNRRASKVNSGHATRLGAFVRDYDPYHTSTSF